MTTTTQGEHAQTAPGYEHQRAIMEGERNASLDSYSRVVYLTSAESRLYEAAFTNGWDRHAAQVAALTAAPGVQAEPLHITHGPLMRHVAALLRSRKPVLPDHESVAAELGLAADGHPTPSGEPSAEWLEVMRIALTPAQPAAEGAAKVNWWDVDGDKYDDSITRAPPAPTAQAAPAAGAVAGWQWVPTVPTEEMCRAMDGVGDSYMEHGPNIWAAMLAAAPQPPTAPATQQDPTGWYVTGCSRLLDEDEAKAEARHIGGTARAIPLYTAPQSSPVAQGDALSHAVRVPLDSLHADAAYLIGRLREGSMPYARVIEIIRERIDAAFPTAQAAPAAGAVAGMPPGISALMCVISSLRDTAHFSDEEGELTDELRTLRDWAMTQAAAPTPAAQADSVLELERICAAIKAEDDYCVEHGDYMLDSDDCIKIVRGEWVRPDFSVAAARKQGGL